MCFERRPDARRAHALPLVENLNSLRFRETDRSVHTTHNAFAPKKFQRFKQVRSLSFPGYTQPKCWKDITDFDLSFGSKTLKNIIAATQGTILKKIMPAMIGKSNGMKHRLLKGIVSPSFVSITKTIQDKIKDIDDGMCDTAKVLSFARLECF